MAKAKEKYKVVSPEADRIGAVIRTYRKMRKLTQEKLAELADVSVNTIYNIENGIGDAGFGTVCGIGKILQIPGDELLYGHCVEKNDSFPPEFDLLDEEDKKFVRRSLKATIMGCLSDMKYKLRA